MTSYHTHTHVLVFQSVSVSPSTFIVRLKFTVSTFSVAMAIGGITLGLIMCSWSPAEQQLPSVPLALEFIRFVNETPISNSSRANPSVLAC